MIMKSNIYCVLIVGFFARNIPASFCDAVRIPLQHKFTIGVLSSRHDGFVELAFQSALEETTKLFPNRTAVAIEMLMWGNLSLSLKSSLVDFCGQVISKNISALIILDDFQRKFFFVPWVATKLGIPVTLVQNTREFPLIQEHEFSTVFSMTPKASEQSAAIRGLMSFFRWTHFTVITVNEQNPIETDKFLKTLMDHDQLRTMTVTKVEPFNSQDLQQKLLIVRKSDAVVIVLHCSTHEAKPIFDAARKLGLLERDRAWIVTDQVMESISGIPNAPAGLLGLQLRAHCTVEKPGTLVSRMLHDSFLVIAEAALSATDLGWLPRTSSSCEAGKTSIQDNFLRFILRRKIKYGSTGPIEFDLLGNRINPEYDIMNLQHSNKGALEWVRVGFWSEGKINCNRSPIEWPGRRSDAPPNILHSKVLRVVTAITKPFAYYSITEDDTLGTLGSKVCAIGLPCRVYQQNTNNTTSIVNRCCKGFVIDLLRMLENDVGFKADLHVVKDGMYGGQDSRTGQWNGLIGEVIRNDADLAIADLTITDARSRVVDFTHPFFPVGMSILVAVRKERSGWLVRFLEPFSTELWLVAILSVNIIFILLWIIDKKSPYGHYKKGENYKERKKFHMIASLWFTWGAIFHIDECEARPRSSSSRFIALVFAFGMLIVTNTYTAKMAAVLVSEAETLPVSQAGIHDPKLQNPPAGFKLATVRDTSMEKVFKASHDPVFARIWRHMKHNLVDTFAEGVEKVINGQITAFIGDEPTLIYAIAQHSNCNLRLAGKSFFHSGFGIATRKNSTLINRFSEVLILYERFDTSRKLAHRWLSGTCSQTPDSMSLFTRMSILDLGGAYVITCIGILLALVILIVEFYVDKYGFPFSYIWTNKPHRSFLSARVRLKRAAEISRHLSLAPLELSFGQRRSTCGDDILRDQLSSAGLGRDMEEINEDLFSERDRDGFPRVLFSSYHDNRSYVPDDEEADEGDSGLGSIQQNHEK